MKTKLQSLELQFNELLAQHQEGKKLYGNAARFETTTTELLDDVTADLANILHPIASAEKTPADVQKYTLEIELDNFDGAITKEYHHLVGTLADAREKLTSVMNSLDYQAGASGHGWDSCGHGI